jgi:hypothetical protein
MLETIQKISHHIRTIHGDSEQSFSGRDWSIPIHGVGQGNGAGPQIWAAVSTPLLKFTAVRGMRCSFEFGHYQRTCTFCWIRIC